MLETSRFMRIPICRNRKIHVSKMWAFFPLLTFKILDDHYKMNFTPGSHSESIQPLNFHLPPDHQRLRIIHPPKDNSNCMPRRPPDGQALSSAGLGSTSTNTCWHAARIIQRKFPRNPRLWIFGNFCTTLYISLPPNRNPVMLMIAPASLLHCE